MISLMNGDSSIPNQRKKNKFLKFLVPRNFDLKSLKRNEKNINMQIKLGGTALHFAAYEHDVDAIESFLSLGAEINAKDSFKQTPLHYVFLNNEESGAYKTAEILLLKGADVNARDEDRNTPLYSATQRNFSTVVKLLLKNNAKVNIKGPMNYTPLENSIKSDNIEIVKLLISDGANVNNISKSEYVTPLNLACQDKKFEIVECLLKNGADIEIFDSQGETCVHRAMSNTNSEIREFLFKLDVNVNVKNKWNQTPLFKALKLNNIELVRELIKLGADVNVIDNTEHRTPLNFACARHYLEIMKILLENGANPDKVDAERFTPLMDALSKRHFLDAFDVQKEETAESKTELLLMHGANINILTPYGRNILDVTRYRQSAYIILLHIAKLQELGMTVNSSMIDTISNDDEFNYLLKVYKQELSKAKQTKLRNCWVTFFNILTDDEKSIVKYAGNQDLIKDFERCYLTKEFPNYSESMQKRMSKGVRIRKLWDLAASKLSYNLAIFNPTHLIIRDVLDCLSEDDLLKLN